VEISDIHNLIKAAKNRLDLLGFIDNSDENANAKQLLNMALKNIEFLLKSVARESWRYRNNTSKAWNTPDSN